MLSGRAGCRAVPSCSWAPELSVIGTGGGRLESALFTALADGSFGHLALRLEVVRIDGGPLTSFLALVRQFLVCLVVPPGVFDRDTRGLHDLAVGTVTVRR